MSDYWVLLPIAATAPAMGTHHNQICVRLRGQAVDAIGGKCFDSPNFDRSGVVTQSGLHEFPERRFRNLQRLPEFRLKLG